MSNEEQENSAVANSRKSATSTNKKSARLISRFSGIPEADYFPSDEQRDVALAQVVKEVGNWRKNFYRVILLFVLVNIAAHLLLWYVSRFVAIPSSIRTALPGGLIGGSFVFILNQIHRRKYPLLLRKKLIEQGVPMCLKCGYNLRGQPTYSTRCPECGTAINDESKKILRGA